MTDFRHELVLVASSEFVDHRGKTALRLPEYLIDQLPSPIVTLRPHERFRRYRACRNGQQFFTDCFDPGLSTLIVAEPLPWRTIAQKMARASRRLLRST